MKKTLFAALLLTAGAATASAQNIELYISNEVTHDAIGNITPINYQKVEEGQTYKALWEYNEDYEQQESVVYLKTVNKTSSLLDLTMKIDIVKNVNNVSEFPDVNIESSTCWGGNCTAPGASTVAGTIGGGATLESWGEHSMMSIGYIDAEQAAKLSLDCIANYTISAGDQSIKFTVLFQSPDVAGVEGIAVDNGEATYYNLQGLKVANPEQGQLYIKRQAGKATKVIF